MPAFDALILDLFGVVVAFDEDLVYRRLARHCADPARAFAAMQGLVSTDALIRGQLTLPQLHGKLVAELGLALDPSGFEAAWLEPYTTPMPGMAGLIHDLAARHRLVLLSNVDKDYWLALRSRHAELGAFGALLLSWQLGRAKPDPEVFRRAVAAAGVPAARCFFVDDKAENVDAARALGIAGHRFAGVDGLRAALRRAGIG